MAAILQFNSPYNQPIIVEANRHSKCLLVYEHYLLKMRAGAIIELMRLKHVLSISPLRFWAFMQVSEASGDRAYLSYVYRIFIKNSQTKPYYLSLRLIMETADYFLRFLKFQRKPTVSLSAEFGLLAQQIR